MNPTTRLGLAAALLLAPLAARAQRPSAPASPGALAAAPAMADAAEPFPRDAVDDGGVWFDDDPIAFGLGDEFDLRGSDLDSGDDDAPPAMDDTPGPDGERRGVGRDFGHGPGGMGMRRGHPDGRAMFGRGAPMMMRLKLAQLDLSDTQRSRLRDLHEAHARKAIQRRADMQLARMDLGKLMRADKADAGAVNAQIDRIARLQADGLKAAFEVRMQARAVLTPEQIKKLHSPMDPMRLRRDMLDTLDGRPKR